MVIVQRCKRQEDSKYLANKILGISKEVNYDTEVSLYQPSK